MVAAVGTKKDFIIQNCFVKKWMSLLLHTLKKGKLKNIK
jgi:hypothetical protein